ncbi:MAG: hypothetical protein L0196_02385 [candidate division Zixibacteria bacterium]|nr:hypothetical protein [candidate division Zixibacteria bacterium]
MRRLLAFLSLSLACAEAPADRVVYTFFDAMRQGDANRMAEVLDSSVYLGRAGVPELDTLMPGADFEARRNRILLELTGGNLKRLWLSKQVIVGRTERAGDTDWVEVSFVDPERELHYLTGFGLLKKKGETWRIFSFKRV